MTKRVFLFICLLCAANAIAAAGILAENFDNIATLPGAGWAAVNNSAPLGTTDWFQGNTGVFTSQGGPPESYIAANFLNADSGGNISNWLLTPVVSINNGDWISFYTRSAASFPDRLEVRLSISGASTDVGTTDTSVGDFDTLLFTINPGLDTAGYPDAWTQFTGTVSGLGAPTTGRYAFRYFVSDTSINGDYIGIDTLSIDSPEPASILTLGSALAGLVLVRRLRFRRNYGPK
jgi:hypothetical protein